MDEGPHPRQRRGPDKSWEPLWWDGGRWRQRRLQSKDSTVAKGAAPSRTFLEAIKVCLTKYLDGSGRASRSEFWYFQLFAAVATMSAFFLAPDGVSIALALFLMPPATTVLWRRLHDVGEPAWSEWMMIPGLRAHLYLRLLTKPGDPEPNAWG